MKFLNLGCGYPRIEGAEWVNVDNLLLQLQDGTPEKDNLLAETNYIDHDITTPLPFSDSEFDGVLASHVFEHFDAQEGLRIMVECRRVLKPSAPLLVSVPDASYFRRVHAEDRVSNWPRLFGVTDPQNPISSFFEAALWFDQHKAILTEDALWGYFTRAGFKVEDSSFLKMTTDNEFHFVRAGSESACEAMHAMRAHLNRRQFSLEMVGLK